MKNFFVFEYFQGARVERRRRPSICAMALPIIICLSSCTTPPDTGIKFDDIRKLEAIGKYDEADRRHEEYNEQSLTSKKSGQSPPPKEMTRLKTSSTNYYARMPGSQFRVAEPILVRPILLDKYSISNVGDDGRDQPGQLLSKRGAILMSISPAGLAESAIMLGNLDVAQEMIDRGIAERKAAYNSGNEAEQNEIDAWYTKAKGNLARAKKDQIGADNLLSEALETMKRAVGPQSPWLTEFYLAQQALYRQLQRAHWGRPAPLAG